jgi:hypothetical protein
VKYLRAEIYGNAARGAIVTWSESDGRTRASHKAFIITFLLRKELTQDGFECNIR